MYNKNRAERLRLIEEKRIIPKAHVNVDPIGGSHVKEIIDGWVILEAIPGGYHPSQVEVIPEAQSSQTDEIPK